MSNKSLKKRNLRNKNKSIKNKNIKGGSVDISGSGTHVNSVSSNKPVIEIKSSNEIVSPFNEPAPASEEQQGGARNVPVNIDTNILPYHQWNNPNVNSPAHQYQSGVFTGPQAYGPWGGIPVTPTTSNMINNNLKSANPPPEATIQYPGTDHLGNNFSAMPGVNWYNNTTEINPGPFRIKGTPTPQKGGKRNKKNKNKKQKKGGKQNIPVDIKTNILPNQQWNNPNSAAPISQYQGGIYTGPQAYGPWGAIPVTPTTSNMINNNLRSAKPPPGAIKQYPGTNRLGNNFSTMPGVQWYNNTTEINPGPFRIKGGKKTKKSKGGSGFQTYPSYCDGKENWSQCGITSTVCNTGGKKKRTKGGSSSGFQTYPSYCDGKENWSQCGINNPNVCSTGGKKKSKRKNSKKNIKRKNKSSKK